MQVLLLQLTFSLRKTLYLLRVVAAAVVQTVQEAVLRIVQAADLVVVAAEGVQMLAPDLAADHVQVHAKVNARDLV